MFIPVYRLRPTQGLLHQKRTLLYSNFKYVVAVNCQLFAGFANQIGFAHRFMGKFTMIHIASILCCDLR